MSYVPLFNSRSSSARHQSSSIPDAGPDFGAFDDPSDGEEDAHVLPTIHSGHLSQPRGLLSSLDRADNGSNGASQHPRRDAGGRVSPQMVPGAYDFEAQANEGGPPPSIQHRTRPTAAARPSPPPHSSSPPPRAYWTPLAFTERFLPATVYSRLAGPPADRESSSRLLFSQEDEDDTDVEGGAAARPTYPPHGTASLIPLPPRPLPGLQSTRVFGGGQGNDGVFANLSAKPDGMRRGEGEYVGGDDSGSGDKDEVPPSYEAAALDSTPPYWETTIITPQGLLGPDDISVDGLPVGNLFGFAWSMLVSMSFQFVGFLLTYLLHTTHAAKNGSRAGLGITLIQLGLYLKDRPPPVLININDHSSEGPFGTIATSTLSALGSIPTQIHGALAGALAASDPDMVPMPSLGDFSGEEVVRMSAAANEWMAFMLVTIGSFLFVGSCLSYWRAVRWARAVRQGMGPGNDVEVVVE